jgi:hypothetical protein
MVNERFDFRSAAVHRLLTSSGLSWLFREMENLGWTVDRDAGGGRKIVEVMPSRSSYLGTILRSLQLNHMAAAARQPPN